jgi:osmotically-inducible protein OsmY
MIDTRELSADEQVQRDVLDELHWDGEVKPTNVGVEVHDGVVTLTGMVTSYRERRAAAEVALRVYGVRGVVNEIEVRTIPYVRSDTDIARIATEQLEWDTTIPENRVKVRVSDGWVSLEGTVDKFFQKMAAERTIEGLAGVRGVSNLIEIEPEHKPHVSAAELKTQIEKAFTRNAEIDARRINVHVHDGTVTLSGNVRSWAEHRQATRAAWSMPGVKSVKDLLQVVP